MRGLRRQQKLLKSHKGTVFGLSRTEPQQHIEPAQHEGSAAEHGPIVNNCTARTPVTITKEGWWNDAEKRNEAGASR